MKRGELGNSIANPILNQQGKSETARPAQREQQASFAARVAGRRAPL
jgi:hypothetical protein